MTMSDSTEARPQQLDCLDDEEWMIGGTNYSIKCSRSQPNSGIKSLAGCLRCGHAPIVLRLLAFLLLAGLLVITLAQVSKGPNTQGQEESKHENLSLKLTQQKDELFSKVLSSQENKTRQVISEQLKQLKAELLSKISDQEQNKSMQKIPEQLSQLKAELLSKIPIPQGQNESIQKISEQLIQLKDDLVSKITIIQAQEDSKQMISQQLTQLKAQLYNLCRPCPWDWTSFAGNCYFFSMSQRNWNDAVTACHEVGAQLVIVKSEEEQTFLQQTSKAKGLTWMGLSDLNREAAWLWVDGSPLSPSFQKYWNSGEPNNIGEEDCAEFSGTGWNDSKCDLRKFWICKKAETPCNTS